MVEICPHNDCTGCGLCASLCPVSCIRMREGALGHLYPVIGQDRCTDCGLCAKVCPGNAYGHSVKQSDTVSGSGKFFRPDSAWAAWARDPQEYVTSTSGGAASVLSAHVLSRGGAVYGCAVDPGREAENGHSGKPFEIKHIRIVDSPEDLARLKGSKYVQSSISGVLPMIKADARKGIPVLFIGTPCQVAAVRSLLRNVPDNVMLVDIICHGVPSASLFRKYLQKDLHVDPARVKSVSFRNSKGFVLEINGGKDYTHRPLKGMRTEELYYNLFMDGFTYRDSCYSCPFARIERISDMTIGDFWGLGKDVPEHPHGVSLILPVTEKGHAMIPVLQESMHMYRRSVPEAAAGNDQLRSPWHKAIRIRIFRAVAPLLGLKTYYPLVIDRIIKKRIRAAKRRRKS